MRQWRMRTTLMVSLLAVSLGLTATCLLTIGVSVQQEIHKRLDADLSHSLSTFHNIADQRNQMLSREAALLADLPSLKALMATQDKHTIQDGSQEFWITSGSDFFALVSPAGSLFTYSNRGSSLSESLVNPGLQTCMSSLDDPCLVAFGSSLYELSIQPLYFGPPANGSQLGYVVIGYAIDQQVAHEVSDVAAADVVFLVGGHVAAATLPPDRLPDLGAHGGALSAAGESTQKVRLNGEMYVASAAVLPTSGKSDVQLVVLKSYDRASLYLRRVNRWIITLGLSALLLGLLLAASISRTVTRPLEALVAGTRALGQGDFSYRLSTEGAVEVRELGLAFDRMRDELQRTQRELLESDRLATIGRMASSVSHDLRHHLSAIYANAEFMSLPQTGVEERTELLLEVNEAVQGMTDLIESLLLFGQTGQVLHLQYESVALLVERVVHTVRQHPECRHVEVVVADLQAVDAWVDGGKLGRALYNLVLNACQACRSGAIRPKVTVTLTEDEEKIQIGICDNGRGVPLAIRETLFQPFVSSGKVNGVGLGLTVAQLVAQEHGGEVRLEPSTRGTTLFKVTLYKHALAAVQRSQAEPIAVVDEHESEPENPGIATEPSQEHR